ncbi:MAG: hypothetical protein AAF433_13160 [Bacteroidota bacterium]
MYYRICIALLFTFSLCTITTLTAQENAEDESSKISWSPDQELQPEQFNGPVINDELPAFAHTGMDFKADIPSRRQLNFRLVTTFDPSASFFQAEIADDSAIDRERLRFDLTEVFARRIRQQIQGGHLRKSKVLDQLTEIITDEMTDLVSRQERFTTETLEDPNQLPKWRSWVDAELNRLDAYTETAIEIRLR